MDYKITEGVGSLFKSNFWITYKDQDNESICPTYNELDELISSLQKFRRERNIKLLTQLKPDKLNLQDSDEDWNAVGYWFGKEQMEDGSHKKYAYITVEEDGCMVYILSDRTKRDVIDGCEEFSSNELDKVYQKVLEYVK